MVLPTKSFGPTPPKPPPRPIPPIPAPKAGSGALTAMGGTGYRAPTPSPVRNLPSSRGAAGSLTPGTQFNSSGGGPATPRPLPGGGVGGTPAPIDFGGGGGSGGGGGGGWRDAAYLAQIAAIDRALSDYETGLNTRVGRYGQDYTRGTAELGYRPGEGFVAAPDILPYKTLEEGMAAIRRPGATVEGGAPLSAAQMLGGQWDYEGNFNPYSAATRGTRTARDEFAGRGMLRSSDFAQSYGEFQDRLNQQLEAMETGRGRFLEDSVTDLSQQRATAEERRQAARRDAIMRAALQSLGG